MTDQQCLADRLEEHRSRLRAVAYRMLGSPSEADDAVPGHVASGWRAFGYSVSPWTRWRLR
jgi:DNA-directed RNA polymerase specialized sigma24 family protein